MRTRATLIAAKAAGRLTRLTGRGGGTAIPGVVAERLDPQLVAKLVRSLPNGCILVTGTNGMTTTTKLLAAVLEASGERVLTNRSGSNLKRGIVSTMVANSNLRGELAATIGLFEVDEASLRVVAPLLTPKAIVVTNLFRDQLDRYGELDATAAMIGEGIASTKADLYLNADDPLVASLSKYAKSPEQVNYFGIEGLPAELATGDRSAVDSDRCPMCGSRLIFDRVFYAHIGHYHCPQHDFARPQPTTTITSVSLSDQTGQICEVSLSGKRYEAELILPGVYNLYNALAALAVAQGLGLAPELAISAVAGTAGAFGRVEELVLDRARLKLILIKNPTGFAQVMETFLVGAGSLKVAFIINDNFADGRDISWLWDVPLERLAALQTQAITSGTRGADMALRLKYAGIMAELVDTPARAIERLASSISPNEEGYVLATYTAMTQLRNELKLERFKV